MSVSAIFFFSKNILFMNISCEIHLMMFTKPVLFDPCNDLMISVLKPQNSAFMIIPLLTEKQIFSSSTLKAHFPDTIAD